MGIKLCVNFLGAPNSGKTVASTSIFSQLKKRHIDAVLVNEYAHEKVVEENERALKNQLIIWANQQYQIYCAYEHAQVTVTDSPILLGAIYNKRETSSFQTVVLEEHRKYNNLNIIMRLDDTYPYSMVGRIHSLNEAQTISEEIVNLLETHNLPYLYYNDYSEPELLELIASSLE